MALNVILGRLTLPDAPHEFQIFLDFESLKDQYRLAWPKRGMPEQLAEKTAGHIFSHALLVDILAERYAPELNRFKMVRMALGHEFGEVGDGDKLATDDSGLKDRHVREERSVSAVTRRLPGSLKDEYYSLWQEFEARQTPEAQFVFQVDRLEFAFQHKAHLIRGLVHDAEMARVRQYLKNPGLLATYDAVMAYVPAGSDVKPTISI